MSQITEDVYVAFVHYSPDKYESKSICIGVYIDLDIAKKALLRYLVYNDFIDYDTFDQQRHIYRIGLDMVYNKSSYVEYLNGLNMSFEKICSKFGNPQCYFSWKCEIVARQLN